MIKKATQILFTEVREKKGEASDEKRKVGNPLKAPPEDAPIRDAMSGPGYIPAENENEY